MENLIALYYRQVFFQQTQMRRLVGILNNTADTMLILADAVCIQMK
jgi:hypothetical protein